MAVTFDKQLEIADVYAGALFDLAREAGKVDEVREELEELVKLREHEDAGVAEFFVSRALDDDTRTALIEKLFRGKLSDLTLDTLAVMNRHGRPGLLPALLRCFVLRQEAAAGQIEATATSAAALSEQERAAVAELAARLSGKKPLLKFEVDPDLIGGLILQIGDLRYDNSVRTHLNTALEGLRARSERGLEVEFEMANRS